MTKAQETDLIGFLNEEMEKYARNQSNERKNTANGLENNTITTNKWQQLGKHVGKMAFEQKERDWDITELKWPRGGGLMKNYMEHLDRDWELVVQDRNKWEC